MKDINDDLPSADTQLTTINQLLDEHESQGTALAKLARDAGFPPHRLYYHQRKRQTKQLRIAKAQFAPVKLISQPSHSVGLELLIGTDLRLRIPAGSDPAQVAAMAGALRKC